MFNDIYYFSLVAITSRVLILWYIYRVPTKLDFPTGSYKVNCSVLGGVSCWPINEFPSCPQGTPWLNWINNIMKQHLFPFEKGLGPIVMTILIILYFYYFLFIFERERAEEGQREGDRGSEVGSVLTSENPMWGSNLQTWDQDLSLNQALTDWATQVPRPNFSKVEFYRNIVCYVTL